MSQICTHMLWSADPFPQEILAVEFTLKHSSTSCRCRAVNHILYFAPQHCVHASCISYNTAEQRGTIPLIHYQIHCTMEDEQTKSGCLTHMPFEGRLTIYTQ